MTTSSVAVVGPLSGCSSRGKSLALEAIRWGLSKSAVTHVNLERVDVALPLKPAAPEQGGVKKRRGLMVQNYIVRTAVFCHCRRSQRAYGPTERKIE